MEQPKVSLYSVSDFQTWNSDQQLDITPKFQRGKVWTKKAKSYLIDSILKSMPIPPIFMRLKIDPAKRRPVREIIDGQQRISAVLEFIDNQFPILATHNKIFGGKLYKELNPEVQRNLLSYQFQVNVLTDIGDSEVLSIFSRINTYNVPLNAQELRNATFFGEFKTTVYDISRKFYAFWRNNKIFTDQQIARMSDAEFVSIILTTVIKGIQQTKAEDLRLIYEEYDSSFPFSDKAKTRFDEVIDAIGNVFGNELADSEFRRAPLFYSVFVVLYDAKFGIPNSKYPRQHLTAASYKELAGKLALLSKVVTSKKPPTKYKAFVDATRLSTADVGKRKLRHRFLWKELFSIAK